MTAEPLEEPQLPTGQASREDQTDCASGSNVIDFPAPAKPPAQPTRDPSARGPELPTGQSPGDTQSNAAGGTDFPADQRCADTQSGSVGRDQTSTSGQAELATHGVTAARGPILEDPFLGILAETVDDLEGTRKALANRYRQLTRVGPDKDGKHRGFGLPESAPEVAAVRALLVAVGGDRLDGSGGIEHQAVLKLNGQMRKHLLWKTWGVHQKGVGEKQLARLLASIGDPYWNGLHGRPRRVSELWSYCGLSVVHSAGQRPSDTQTSLAGGVAPKKQRGQKVEWSTDARMRAWNIAGSCLKAQGGYAGVYYEARTKYAESLHPTVCVRCGPEKNPAQPGSPLSDAHKHARAIRIVMKEILRDLWLASKALHEAEPT